jgi:HD-like signal output (HDOD) protein
MASDDFDLDIDVELDAALPALASARTPAPLSSIDRAIATRVPTMAVAIAPSASRLNHAAADGAPLPELTRLVESDGALTNSVLRLACSPAYSGSSEAVSLPYAVMRLGRQGVRAVCLTASFAKLAMRPGPFLPLRRRVWRECLASALVCQTMAAPRGASADDAFLLGLLHDFGKVMALGAVESELNAPAANDEPFWAAVMERHHLNVGWMAVEAWRVATPIRAVTERHHEHPGGDPLHAVVVGADRVVAAAARKGWQISAEEIGALPDVRSKDEAMALRIALAKHPYFLTALG